MHRLPLPDTAASLRPVEIGRLVAEHLAQVLPGGPWRVTREGIKSTQDAQPTELTLQRSTASRTGQGLWLYPRLTVRDELLARWRSSHPELAGRHDDILFDSLLINISEINAVEILTTVGPAAASDGTVSYEAFVAGLLDDVLPNRERLRSAETVVSLPDRWLWNALPLIEWSCASGRPELAWTLAERCVGDRPARRQAFARGRAAARDGGATEPHNSMVRLGHFMGRLERHYELGDPQPWLNQD